MSKEEIRKTFEAGYELGICDDPELRLDYQSFDEWFKSISSPPLTKESKQERKGEKCANCNGTGEVPALNHLWGDCDICTGKGFIYYPPNNWMEQYATTKQISSEDIEKIKIYGKYLSEFLLPDQIEILARELSSLPTQDKEENNN